MSTGGTGVTDAAAILLQLAVDGGDVLQTVMTELTVHLMTRTGAAATVSTVAAKIEPLQGCTDTTAALVDDDIRAEKGRQGHGFVGEERNEMDGRVSQLLVPTGGAVHLLSDQLDHNDGRILPVAHGPVQTVRTGPCPAQQKIFH